MIVVGASSSTGEITIPAIQLRVGDFIEFSLGYRSKIRNIYNFSELGFNGSATRAILDYFGVDSDVDLMDVRIENMARNFVFDKNQLVRVVRVSGDRINWDAEGYSSNRASPINLQIGDVITFSPSGIEITGNPIAINSDYVGLPTASGGLSVHAISDTWSTMRPR